MHDAQHDELARGVPVAERHDGAFVVADARREDVDAGVEKTDRLAGARLPQPDGAVLRARHHHVVVVRDGAARHLAAHDDSVTSRQRYARDEIHDAVDNYYKLSDLNLNSSRSLRLYKLRMYN